MKAYPDKVSTARRATGLPDSGASFRRRSSTRDGAGLHRAGDISILRRRPDRRWLATSAVEHFQELVDLDLPVAFRAGKESVRDAMLQVIGQRLLLDAVGRGAAAANRKLALSSVAGFDSPTGNGVVGNSSRLQRLSL